MKAEHRKELETNILADKMGRLITGAKQGPSRGLVFYLLIGLGVAVVAFLIYRWMVTSSTRASELWLGLEDGDREVMAALRKTGGADNPGKVALFDAAWEQLWIGGIKRMGVNPTLALESIKNAEAMYTDLAKVCENDPVFHPEALYGLAIIEETRLVEKPNRDAGVALVIEKYNAVSKANKESAFAKSARERVDQLEDENKSREILRFYMELEDKLKGFARPPGLPKEFGDFEEFLKKKGE
jgi:hypothetical protein